MKIKIFFSILLILFIGLNAAGMQKSEKSSKKQDRKKAKQTETAAAPETTKQTAAEEKEVQPPEVLMHDYADITEDKLIYWSNVEFIWDEYRIYADYIEYDPKTKIVTAKGRVTMTSKETVVSGEKLVIDLKEKTGELYDVYGQMQPTVRYTAKVWKQTEEDTYKFKNLRFTSCAQCVPRWKITCTNGKIKKEKYIRMTNAVIKIKKIPVLYIPYLSYPISDRATGFLFPVPGNHYIGGFTLKNAFYWDIKPNVDLTLYLDYYSKAGWGAAEEFRYLFKNMEGDLKFYLLKYRMTKDESDGKLKNVFSKQSESDYYMNFKHIQRINFLDTTIKLDVDNQSDPAFLRLFDNNFDRSLSNRYYSSFQLNSSLSNITLGLNASKNVTYYTFQEKAAQNVIQYLPSISLNVNQQKIWKIPGYFSLESAFDSVTRSGVNYEAGEELFQPDFNSKRYNLTPSYTLNLFALPWLSSTVSLGSKNIFYLKSKDPKTKEIVDEPIHINYNMISTSLKGPIFYKIYETQKSKIKHLIEPEIKFHYSTKLDKDITSRLVRVDWNDLPSYSYIEFNLASRLLKKDKESDSFPTEILSFSINQKYYIDPVEANYYRKIDNEYPEFSELENRLRLRLIQDFSLDMLLSYNYYIKEFDNASVLLAFNRENSILKGSLAYSVYKNPYKENFFRNKTYLRGDLDITIPGFPLKLETGLDYDMTDKVIRYGAVMASFNYQCINFSGEVRLYTRFSGELDYQYNFGISFGNIGIVRDFLGSQR